MSRMRLNLRPRRWRQVLQAVGLACLVLLVVGPSTESAAQLRPYYVLRSGDAGAIKPRILFVMDTSGSMAFRSLASNSDCLWNRCENDDYANTNHESRLAAARRAIRETVATSSDSAKFSLMTFDHYGPHTSRPPKCGHRRQARRFVWVRYAGLRRWNLINRAPGRTGTWALCQGNRVRPYPYLRWNNLGVGSVIRSNNQAGALPPSPLVSINRLSNRRNANRRVQWFSEFMGVRFKPNAATDPDRRITNASYGDYGSTNRARRRNVYNHDFYYWPYVDGFPGYAAFYGWPYRPGSDALGIAGSDPAVSQAELFAPFYLDLSSTSIPADKRGPSSEEAALEGLAHSTARMIEGGVDATGGTPWASVVGQIPARTTQSNAHRSHTSVASYLQFVTTGDTPDVCAPTAAVLLTDGQPSRGEDGPILYSRLAALRRGLDVPVYVVGFLQGGDTVINEMACAAAGACDGGACTTPCNDEPADDFDTCRDPTNPHRSCAYQASSAEELRRALAAIVTEISDTNVPSGPGAEINEFGLSGSDDDDDERTLQTELRAHTEYPSWRGHVTREPCSDRDDDGELLPHCVPVDPEFADEDIEPTFGPCSQSRVWDAGVCLQKTKWNARRLYTHNADNEIFRISKDDGSATSEFTEELVTLGLISRRDPQAQADAIAAFVLGRDAPRDWKLPGLANSAPITVRRIPPYNAGQVPEVAIRDPHCGGRTYPQVKSGSLPSELYTFARDAWDEDLKLFSPSPHHAYQEMVMVGDDFGVLHAFGLNHGNELWGLLPRFALAGLAEKAALGAATYGQLETLEDHNYGLAATLNHGWVFDDRASDSSEHTWRHLGIIGMGTGGTEYIALDLSHGSPVSPQGPTEILWTSEDRDLKRSYDDALGETWARPALTYIVPGDDVSNPPEAHFIIGSGYRPDGGDGVAGRLIADIDALRGTMNDYAILPEPEGAIYEPNYAALVDPVAATHCRSRFWAEMQEVYVADPAGRLFRWDLGRDQDHASDGGGRWNRNARSSFAEPLFACVGAGDTCDVHSRHQGEPFAFAPSVSALDRIDDFQAASHGVVPANEQFLIALISGSPSDNALPTSFHSSIHLLVDDHSGEDKSGGFSIPSGNPKTKPGSESGYMRLALSDITRTRSYVPFPGARTYTETRTFSGRTRPLRAPRIFVTGVVERDGASSTPKVIDGVEVYYVEFTVYEPPQLLCDPAFYDREHRHWHTDPGSSYKITFRLTADNVHGFDFTAGADPGLANFGDDFAANLVLHTVTQAGSGDCAGDGCGSDPGAGGQHSPCTLDGETGGGGGTGILGGVPLRNTQIRGFTPFE